MSDSELELFSESQPNDDLLSPDCSMNEQHSSSGSDVGSEEDDGGRNRKRPYQLTSVTRKNKSTRLDVRSKSHSSACHKPCSVVSGPPSKAVEVDETKSALKEITSLLNTVVKRLENVEDELQKQRTTCPSSSTDSTPIRSKPSLFVRVS